MVTGECVRGANDQHRKQKQEADTAESLSERINAIFDSSDHAVFGVNARGNIGYWNRHCEALFKLPSNISISGKHSSDLLCGGDERCRHRECSRCAISMNTQTEKQINGFTLSISQADGSPVRVTIDTCYFYQPEPGQICTYFSLKQTGD